MSLMHILLQECFFLRHIVGRAVSPFSGTNGLARQNCDTQRVRPAIHSVRSFYETDANALTYANGYHLKV